MCIVVLQMCINSVGSKLFELSRYNKMLRICQYGLHLWTLNPKIYKCLHSFVFDLCMKFEESRLKPVWVIALQQSVAKYISLVITYLWPFDSKIYNCLPYDSCHLSMYGVWVSRLKALWVISLQQSMEGHTDWHTEWRTDCVTYRRTKW